jgi:hypothetical protein
MAHRSVTLGIILIVMAAVILAGIVAGCAPPRAMLVDRDIVGATCQGQVRPVPQWCPGVELVWPTVNF